MSGCDLAIVTGIAGVLLAIAILFGGHQAARAWKRHDEYATGRELYGPLFPTGDPNCDHVYLTDGQGFVAPCVCGRSAVEAHLAGEI